MKKIAPSFLAADIWQAANQVAAVEQAGCEYLHLDIMDGHFVPNISFGPGLVKCLRPHSKMVFDTHLMVEDPDFFFEDFAAAGADIITVHAEACRHLDRSLHRIHDLGLQAGVVLNPATPLCMIEEVLPLCELVLLMSVNPGFGGQKFIEHSVEKVRELRALIERTGSKALIEVDGGVNLETGARLVEAGADALVAGNAVFAAPDPEAMIRQLHEL